MPPGVNGNSRKEPNPSGVASPDYVPTTFPDCIARVVARVCCVDLDVKRTNETADEKASFVGAWQHATSWVCSESLH